MDVSVIIVSFNTRELLRDCLDSIIKKTSGLKYEVIIVDNASSDGSVDMVKKEFPWIRIIESKKNIGFGRANNLGMEYATGEYCLLLNSDTILLNNAIKSFYDYASLHQECGVLGSILLDSNQNPSHSFGYLPTPQRLLKDLIFRYLSIIHKFPPYLAKEVDAQLPVEYITGADLWIPASVWKQIGGFDPDYFLYFEETDLQKRMKDNGISRTIIPGPRIMHLEGGSDSGPIWTEQRHKRFFNSQKIYLKKHFSKFINLIFNVIYWPFVKLYIRVSKKCN